MNQASLYEELSDATQRLVMVLWNVRNAAPAESMLARKVALALVRVDEVREMLKLNTQKDG